MTMEGLNVMTERLFETALGLSAPWYVAGTDFNVQARTLTIRVDFTPGSRFAVPSVDGERCRQNELEHAGQRRADQQPRVRAHVAQEAAHRRRALQRGVIGDGHFETAGCGESGTAKNVTVVIISGLPPPRHASRATPP